MDESYAAASHGRFIYSGFRVGDVLRLGDFPDYAALSEVPLPKPAEDFDIGTAQPRPYRPLRWPYHQTMGKTPILVRDCHADPDVSIPEDGD